MDATDAGAAKPWTRYGLLGLGWIVCLLAIGSFGLAALLPVYTDEIVWKLEQGRLGYDGGQSLSITMQPNCGRYATAVPLAALPFRWLDTLFYQDISAPGVIRAIGVGLGLLWFAIAWRLSTKLTRGALNGSTSGLVILAGVSLGIMPFMVFLSRPEQLLLIGITICFLPALDEGPFVRPAFGLSLLRVTGIVLLGMFILSAHPRGIFVLPLVLLACWRAALRPLVTLAGGLIMVIFAAAMAAYWPERWACPSGDPEVLRMFIAFNVMVAYAQGQIGHYLANLISGLANPDTWYITRTLPRIEYSSGIVPGFGDFWIRHYSPLAMPILIMLVATGAAAFVLVLAEVPRVRSLRLPALALASLWGFYLLSVVSRIPKFVYEASVIEPVLILAIGGSLWCARARLARIVGTRRLGQGGRGALVVLLLLSIGSQIGLIATYAPIAAESWLQPGVPPDQNVSIAWVGYDQLHPRILAAARACGLDPDKASRHLVLDEETIFAFRSTYQPILTTYIDENGWGRSIADLPALLTRIGSGGLITRCARVPQSLRPGLIAEGDLCCHGPFAVP